MNESSISPAYHRWPFEPTQRTAEDSARWWAECHLYGPINVRMTDVRDWTIITGETGSGKSIALERWRQDQARTTLLIDYSPSRWPTDGTGHRNRILVGVARAVYERLIAQPELAAGLDQFRREFLRWLMENSGDRRMYRRLVSELGDDNLRDIYSHVEQINFGVDDDAEQLYAIAADLMGLSRGLSLSRIAITIDLSVLDTPEQLAQMRELYGWLTLMEQPALLLVAAMPNHLIRRAALTELSRDRLSVRQIEWTEDDCRQIAEAHLRLAAPEVATLDRLVSPSLVSELLRKIEVGYERPNPAMWVNLVETLLYATCRPGSARLPRPVPPEAINDVMELYYLRHVPLRLDPDERGVWRGPQLIRLQETQYRLLELLNRVSPRPVYLGSQEMERLVGSQADLHTLVSRMRKEVEPIAGRTIYLMTERGRTGYHLEKECRR